MPYTLPRIDPRQLLQDLSSYDPVGDWYATHQASEVETPGQSAAIVDDGLTPAQKAGYRERAFTHEELQARGAPGFTTLTPAQEQQQYNASVIDSAAQEQLADNARRGHGDWTISNPVSHGLLNAGYAVGQAAAIPVGWGEKLYQHTLGEGLDSDVSGAILDQQRASDRASDILRGRRPTTGEQLARNVVTGVADVVGAGGALRKVGLGTKAFLTYIGMRSYDSALKQADEAGLGPTQRHAYAAADAILEIASERLTLGKGRAAAEAFRRPVKQALWQLARSSTENALQETATQLAQNVNQIAHGVKPWSWGNLLDGTGMAAATGGLVAGALGGIGAPGQIRRGWLRNQQQQRQATNDLQLNVQQNVLDAQRGQSAQAAERSQQAQAAASAWLKTQPPATIQAVSQLTDASRAAFQKAAPGAASPNRAIREAIVEQARQDMQQREQLLNAPPAPQTSPTPAPQSSAQPATSTTPGQPLRGWKKSNPQQQTLQPVENPINPEDIGKPIDLPKPAPKWDEGLWHGHRQAIDTAAKEHGVEPAAVRNLVDLELEQSRPDYELRKAVWDQWAVPHKETVRRADNSTYERTVYSFTPQMRELLNGTNTDHSHIPGWDTALQELQGRHPNLTDERISDILKEPPPEPPKITAELVQHAARQAALQQAHANRPGEADETGLAANVPGNVEGVPFDPAHDATGQDAGTTTPGMLQTLRSFQGSGRGALVGFRELRQAMPHLSKAEFDALALRLAERGSISLHRHDAVASLTPEQAAELVYSPRGDSQGKGSHAPGTYFVGANLRQGPASQERPQGDAFGAPGRPSPGQGSLFNGPNRPTPTGSSPLRGGVAAQPQATFASTGAKPRRLENLRRAIARVGEGVTAKRHGLFTGHMSIRKANGMYNTRSGGIRLQQSDNMVTYAHELGHQIDRNTQILHTMAQDPAARGELHGLGVALYGRRRPAAGYVGEGFAEFMRMYLSSPDDARQHAPAVTAIFERMLKSTIKPMPRVRAAVREAQDVAHYWFREMGAQERTASQIRDPHSIGEKVHGAVSGLRNWKRKLATQFIDAAHPLAEVGQVVEQVTGRPLAHEDNPHTKFKAYRGSHNEMIKTFVTDGIYDPKNPTVKIGPSLEEVLKPVSGNAESVAKRTRYFVARHALDVWNHQNMNPGISKEDAAQTVKELHTPELQKAFDGVQTWNQQVNEILKGVDPTIGEELKNVEAAYAGSSYLPLKRIVPEELQGVGTAGGGAPSGRVGKARHGSGYAIKEPIAQLVADKADLLKRAMQRDVVVTALRAMHMRGPGGRPIAALSHLMDEIPVQRVEGGRPAVPPPDVYQITETLPGGTRKTRWIQVSKDFHNALETVAPVQLKGLMGVAFGFWTKASKFGWISANLAFNWIKNPIRDMGSMMVKGWRHGGIKEPGRMLADYFRFIAANLLPRKAGQAVGLSGIQEWQQVGKMLGVGSQNFISDENPSATRMVHNASHTLAAKVLTPANWGRGLLEAISRGIELAQSPEAAARLTVIKHAAEGMGWRPGMNLTTNQQIELALVGKEIMGDYQAKGHAMRTLDLIFPLLSVPVTYGRAAYQAHFPKGMNGLVEGGWKGVATGETLNWRALAAGLATMTVPTVALWLRNRDEDWYKNQNRRQKYANLTVDVPELGLQFILPRNSEEGMLYSAIPQAMLDALYQQNPEQAVEVAKFIVESFEPSAPPLLKEIGAQAANKSDVFSGPPIVPGRMEKLAPAEQFDERTSGLAKLAGEATGLSPMRIDHAVSSATGGITQRLGEGLDFAQSAAAGQPVDKSKIPVVGALFPSGGLTGNRPKPIEQLHEKANLAQQRQHSVENPETESERDRRIRIETAERAVNSLMKERSTEKDPEKRESIMRKAVAIAEAAETGDAAQLRGILHASEYRLEADPAKRSRIVYGALEQLSDSKPKIGRRGVRRDNVGPRQQAYTQHLSSAQTFLAEAGISKREAVDLFREAITRGLGPEQTGRIKNPTARAHRMRLLLQQLDGL